MSDGFGPEQPPSADAVVGWDNGTVGPYEPGRTGRGDHQGTRTGRGVFEADRTGRGDSNTAETASNLSSDEPTEQTDSPGMLGPRSKPVTERQAVAAHVRQERVDVDAHTRGLN